MATFSPSTKAKMKVFVALFLFLATGVDAFAPSTPAALRPKESSTTTTTLSVAVEVSDVETARIAFFGWFFGASGGAGIARSSFPRMYNSVMTIQGLKGVGPTKGGETVGLNFLCGYPEDLCLADIEEVVQSGLTVDQIVTKYPVEGNFLSAKGYLTFSAFEQAYAKANPLVVRAIFDSLNTSTDVCEPDVAQEKLDRLKEDPASLAGELLKAKLLGYSSIFLLLFLLGLADVVAFGHAKDGWFPEWPGLENMPASLFDSETGFTAIPNYWLSDE